MRYPPVRYTPRVPRAALPILLLALASPGAAEEPPPPAGVEDEIVVIATRSEKTSLEVPAHVSTVDFGRLEREGFLAGGDELRGQPGIFFRRGEGDNDAFLLVNFRGVTGNHGNDAFLALVDGIPFVSADEEVLMDEIPYAAVDHLEIVRGPVSALYGRGGIAGAISYSLREPRGSETSLRLAAGSDRYFAATASLGRQREKTSFFLSLDGLSADGWRENNENRRGSFFGRVVAQPGESSSFSGYLNYLQRDYQLGSVVPTLADGTILPVAGGREGFLGSRPDDSESRSVMAAGRFSWLLAEGRAVDATLHLRDRDSEKRLEFYDTFGFDPGRGVLALNGFDSDSRERSAFAEATFDLSFDKVRVLSGASYEETRLDETDYWSGQNGFTFECGFVFFLIEIDYRSGQVLNRDHPCWVSRQHNLSGDTENRFTSAFGQAELALGDRVKVTAGARYDHFGRKTTLATGPDAVAQPQVDASEDHLSPKFSLVYAASAERSFYLNFGEGFASNFGPVWQWDPSSYVRDTRPTTLRNFELGTKGYAAAGRFSYSLSLYAIEQKDRLIFVTNPESLEDFTLPANLATTGQRYRSQGLEATAAWRWQPGGSVELRYGYVDAEWKELVIETFSGPLDLSGTRPNGVPENTFYAGLRQRLGERWEVGISWQWYDDYFITQDNVFAGGAYDLVDLALTWQRPFGAIESASLAVTNLLDEEYYFLFGSRNAVNTAVPGQPRQARLTLQWRF